MLEETACPWTSDQFTRMVDYVTDGVNPMLHMISNITNEDQGIISSWP